MTGVKSTKRRIMKQMQIPVGFLVLACALCFPVVVLSQSVETPYEEPETRNLPYDIWLNPSTLDFKEIQRQAEEYFSDKDQGRGSGYRQWKRWEYLMQDRLTPDGQITNFAARNYKANEKYNQTAETSQQRATSGFWEQEANDGYILGNSGYNPGIGRVNVIAFHPSDQSTIFAGTPAGGLWKTTNEGTSWSCLTNGIPSIGVSGIAVDPSNANIIYILTGDGDGGDTPCIGVLKTYNGGATWQTTGLSFDAPDQRRGYKLAMKPDDNTVLFAVTNLGIYRTENSGTDWTQVRSGSFRDLEFRPNRPDTIYACTTNAFHRTLTGGDSWTTISSGLPTGESRVALAVTDANPAWVYYLAGPGGPTGSFRGLFRSTNNGSSFSTVITSPNILDSSVAGNDNCNDNNGCDQAWYDLAIAVDPNDGDEVITGGINVWRNEDIDDGDPWTIISHWNTNTQGTNNLEYTHADIHDLVYQDNNRLWCGSDGGIFLSTDDGQTWVDKTSAGTSNGLIGTQWYRIDGTPQSSSIIIGGTQDNGSNRWSGGNDITHFDGADGMDCMLDFTNSSIQYHCRQNGSLRKSTNSGSTHSSIRPGNSGGAWITPLRMDPSNNTEIWAGYNDTIYRSTNSGTSWTGFIPLAGSGLFRYIWCAPSNSQVIYAATNNRLFRSGNNGANWSNITSNLPVGSGNITGITTDLDNSNDIWVSFSGYADGEKVYFSSTGGGPYTNISGSLPNVPVNCVVYDDNQVNDNAVYVGTDIGIFYRDASMSDWVPFRNGLPTVPVFDMYVHVESTTLFAGTHGRGLWTSDLYTECPSGYFLSDANAPDGYPQGYRYYQASVNVHSSRDIRGGAGTEVYYKAGDSVRLDEGFRARDMDAFRAWLGACVSGIPEIPLVDDIPDEDMLFDENPDESDRGLDAFMTDIDEVPDLPEIDMFSAEMDYHRSAIVVTTGKASDVRVELLLPDGTNSVIEQSLHLTPGSSAIPISFENWPEGSLTLKIASLSHEEMVEISVLKE